jgi:hypothetical protein
MQSHFTCRELDGSDEDNMNMQTNGINTSRTRNKHWNLPFHDILDQNETSTISCDFDNLRTDFIRIAKSPRHTQKQSGAISKSCAQKEGPVYSWSCIKIDIDMPSVPPQDSAMCANKPQR